jgi:hypothetical protein
MGGSQMPDFTKTPLVPPPSEVSNFVDAATRSPMAIAVSSVMLALSFSSIHGCFYTLKFQQVLRLAGILSTSPRSDTSPRG